MSLTIDATGEVKHLPARLGWSETKKEKLLQSAWKGYLREVRGRVQIAAAGQAPAQNLHIATEMLRGLEAHIRRQRPAYLSDDDGWAAWGRMAACAHNFLVARQRIEGAGEATAADILYALPTLHMMECIALDLGYAACLNDWFAQG